MVEIQKLSSMEVRPIDTRLCFLADVALLGVGLAGITDLAGAPAIWSLLREMTADAIAKNLDRPIQALMWI